MVLNVVALAAVFVMAFVGTLAVVSDVILFVVSVVACAEAFADTLAAASAAVLADPSSTLYRIEHMVVAIAGSAGSQD